MIILAAEQQEKVTGEQEPVVDVEQENVIEGTVAITTASTTLTPSATITTTESTPIDTTTIILPTTTGQVTTTEEVAVDNVHILSFISFEYFWTCWFLFHLNCFWCRNCCWILEINLIVKWIFRINAELFYSQTDATTDENKLVEYDDDDDYLEPVEEQKEPKIIEDPSTPKPTIGLNIFTSTPTTEKITTTTEMEIVNNPPVIKSRLPKQPLTAGKPFGWGNEE